MRRSRRRLLTAAAGLACAAARPGAASAPPRPLPPAPALSAQRGKPLRGMPVLSGLDGKPLDLARFLGRPLLVNLWATWCAPCLAEMPSLQALREASGPPGSGELEVVALNAGQSINQVESYLKTLPLRLPIVMDPGKLALARWNVRVLPTTLLFDAAGLLRAACIGERDWAGGRMIEDIRSILRTHPRPRPQARPRSQPDHAARPASRADS